MHSNSEFLRSAAYYGDLSTIRALIRQNTDLNIWDSTGRTALSLAAGQGNREIVSALIQSGAWIDPHEDYDTYETPLQEAARNGHLEIVKILIDCGANPLMHSGVSQTTAEYAARANGHKEVSQYLQECEGKWVKEHGVEKQGQ